MSVDNKEEVLAVMEFVKSAKLKGTVEIISDDEFSWDRDVTADNKYFYIVHSELNAILNYRGGSLEGSKIYVTLFPCNECAKAIIQSGIKEVIYWQDIYKDTREVIASKRMLRTAGVQLTEYIPSGRIVELQM